MPRYFFDVHDGVDLLDLEGTECPDLTYVKSEAKKLLPQIALDELYRQGERKQYALSVRDEQGLVIYTASLIYTGS